MMNDEKNTRSASMDSPITERQADIVGKPPRIKSLALDELDAAEAIANYEKIRSASSGNTAAASVEEIPELVMTLLRHPELYQRLSDVSVVLMSRGELDARDRQLAVLRLTWLCQAPYAFGEHVKHSRRIGIGAEELERIRTGSADSYWARHEKAILKAVEELHANAMISDDTWSVLAESLNEKQLFELTVLVGQFTLVAYFQNALRLRLRDGNDGLLER